MTAMSKNLAVFAHRKGVNPSYQPRLLGETMDLPDEIRDVEWNREDTAFNWPYSVPSKLYIASPVAAIPGPSYVQVEDGKPELGTAIDKNYYDLFTFTGSLWKNASVNLGKTSDVSMDFYEDAVKVLSLIRQLKAPHALDWSHVVKNAISSAKVVQVLRWCDLHAIADRIAYLNTLSSMDANEPEIDLVSLRSAASFLIDERQLGKPLIGLVGDGHVYCEWRLSPKGILGMTFLPAGKIRYRALLPPNERGLRRKVKGTKTKEKMLRNIEPFTSQLASW